MKDLLDALDHPIVFVILLGMALAGLYSIAAVFLKQLGLQGPATVIQHR